MAIPKIIHYCWLSDDPVPMDLQRYMATWKEKLHDYEFIKWDLTRFDINSSVWVKEAFENKKYAFAADYIRLYALYTIGGVYMDMDVEVMKSFDSLLMNDYFVCFENNTKSQVLEMATLGAEKGCWWIKILLDYYVDRHFVNSDGNYDTKALPQVVRDLFFDNDVFLKPISSIQDYASVDNRTIQVLPYEFFSPKSYETEIIKSSSITYSIHHFSSSWIPIEQRLERRFWQILGLKEHRVMWHFDKWLLKYLNIVR